MRRFLVIANRTLDSEPLRQLMRTHHAEEPTEFVVVVPATPAGQGAAWTEGESTRAARSRLELALAHFAAEGLAASGAIGDPNPVLAAKDACLAHEFTGVIVSTLPPGPSRWLRMDLPHRVARATGLPVAHIIGERAPLAVG